MTIHLAKGSTNLDAAYAYMDAAISQSAQNQLMLPPSDMFPTNQSVTLSPAVSAYINREQLKTLIYPDWESINKNRNSWIRQFDMLVTS